MNQCPRCQTPLGRDVGGLCTACLLEGALPAADGLAEPIAAHELITDTALIQHFGPYELLEEIGRGVDDSFRPPELLLGHRHLAGTGTTESQTTNAVLSVVRPLADGGLLVAGEFSRATGAGCCGFGRMERRTIPLPDSNSTGP